MMCSQSIERDVARRAEIVRRRRAIAARKAAIKLEYDDLEREDNALRYTHTEIGDWLGNPDD
jgi:hypothetical protein